ncbi:MAG: type 4a pilus biogenesis protein PilO [Bacillota bacterium]
MDFESIKRQNIVILLVIVTLVVLSLFKFYQQFRYLDELRTDIVLTEQEISILEGRVTRLLFLKERVPDLIDRSDILTKLLPENLSEQDLIIAVQDSALGTGGRVSEIRFFDTLKGSNYYQLPLRVVFEGDYLGLLKFIRNLYDQPHLTTLQSISITNQKLAEGEGIIKADLNATAYYID